MPFYESNGACPGQCPAICQECSSSTSCTSCQQGSIPNGSTCDQCNPKCLNCSPDIDTCVDGCTFSSRNITNNCNSCDYHTYSAILGGDCDQTCSYKCGNCNEVTPTCIDCSDSTRNLADSCNCHPGFYENSVQNEVCLACDNTQCATCNGPGNSCILSCQTGCQTCNIDQTCINCKTGYLFNSTDNTCTRCNTKCLNCGPDLDTCIDGCADSTRNFTNSCTCNYHTYPSVELQTCDLTCDYKCGNCREETALSGQCIDCSDSNRDPLDSCNCKPGYYEDGTSNPICGTCDNTQCATCNGPGNSCIDPCPAGCQTCNIDQTCIGTNCKTSYLFNSTDNTCSRCNIKCENCGPDLDSCIDGCADSTRNFTNSCACNYHTYPSVELQTCDLTCDYKCGSCREETSFAGQCIDCSDPNRDPTDFCNCKPGYYEDGASNPICGICDNTQCATCNGPGNSCIDSCPAGCITCNSNQTCIGSTCKTGYLFSPTDNSCTRCNIKCENCGPDLDTCIDGCADSTRNFTNSCACNYNTYPSVELQTCDITCDYKCGNCREETSFAGQCIDCSDSNREFSNSCNCKAGYYEDGTSNPICGICDNSQCATCNGPGNSCIDPCQDGCQTCNTDQTCINCKTGYLFNPVDNSCTRCNIKCENCGPDLDTCIDGCADITRNFTNSCSCNYHTYPSIELQTCDLTCDYKCGNCREDAGFLGQCIDCSDSNRDPLNSCNCKLGYFENGISNPICGKCHGSCETCSGINYDQCDTCYNSQNRIHDPINNQCKCFENSLEDFSSSVSFTCQCKPGYYLNVGLYTCLKCPKRCGLCSDELTCLIPCDPNCGTCDVNGKCITCNIGKYLDTQNQSCDQKCHPKCVMCGQQKDQCILCRKGIGRSRDLSKNCGCLEGYYDNGTSNNCYKCSIPLCKVCDSNGDCLECNNREMSPRYNCLDQQINKIKSIVPYKIINSAYICYNGLNREQKFPCKCQDGYYDNGYNYDCIQCPKHCIRCKSQHICLECDQDLELDNYSGKCECQKGFKKNKSQICQQCYYYQRRCYFQCPENTEVFQSQLGGFICQSAIHITPNNLILIYLSWGISFLIIVLMITIINSKKIFKLPKNTISKPQNPIGTQDQKHI